MTRSGWVTVIIFFTSGIWAPQNLFFLDNLKGNKKVEGLDEH